ncbi:MAG TPA: Rrf2 family transcriptional regulator, partial [Acidobacteriota bacterium]|nr:Rrf2 family transcriptional regulator [Acidobacteriota bacterium]
MKITARVEYATLAVFELALQAGLQRVQAKEVSEKQQIPLKFLEQILIQLKNGGLVRSVRGAGGGYFLARPASQITLRDIIEAVEGEVTIVEPKRGGDPTVLNVWREIETEFLEKLESITIQDLVNQKIRED